MKSNESPQDDIDKFALYAKKWEREEAYQENVQIRYEWGKRSNEVVGFNPNQSSHS